jgi:hypothetical protein
MSWRQGAASFEERALMTEFISEVIQPVRGTFDVARMATGVPGLPSGFLWRGQTYTIVEELAVWKQTSNEGGFAVGDRYLRRHYHRLQMSDGATWTVYFVRANPRSGDAKARWFLYTID